MNDEVSQEFLDELRESMAGTSAEMENPVHQLLANLDQELRRGNIAEVNRLALVSTINEDGSFSKDKIDTGDANFSIESFPEEKKIVINQSSSFQISENEIVENTDELVKSRTSFLSAMVVQAGEEEKAKELMSDELRGFVNRLFNDSRHDIGSQVSLLILFDNPDVFDVENRIIGGCPEDGVLLTRRAFVYHHPKLQKPKIITETIAFTCTRESLLDPGVPVDDDEPSTTVTYQWVHTLKELEQDISKVSALQFDLDCLELKLISASDYFGLDREPGEIIEDIMTSNSLLSDTGNNFVEPLPTAYVDGYPMAVFTWKDLDRVGLNLMTNTIDSLDKKRTSSLEVLLHRLISHVTDGQIQPRMEHVNVSINTTVSNGQINRSRTVESMDNETDFGTQSFAYASNSIISDIDGTVLPDVVLSRTFFSIDLTDFIKL